MDAAFSADVCFKFYFILSNEVICVLVYYKIRLLQSNILQPLNDEDGHNLILEVNLSVKKDPIRMVLVSLESYSSLLSS